MIHEISYKLFCSAGGLRNPRLFSRAVTNARGDYVRTAYFDTGNGPLLAMP